MNDPIPLRPEKPVDQAHNEGKARCIACKDEWEAVAPVGVVTMECPSCGLMRGHFIYPMNIGSDDRVWQCDFCQSTHMFISEKSGVRCCGCGAKHRPFDI